MRRIRTLLVFIAVATISAFLHGCGKAKLAEAKLPEGKHPPTWKHANAVSAEARVVYSKVTDTTIEENTKTAIDRILSQHPGKPVVLVQIRLSVNDQLWKSLKAQNPSLSGFREEDYYGTADAIRVDPVTPRGMTESFDGDIFVRQDIIFQVDDHTKTLDVLLKGVSLAKFSF